VINYVRNGFRARDPQTFLPSTKPRILVVEDEGLLAMEIAHAFENAGFGVLGPARTVSRALALLAPDGCDAAVLDVNLGRETSEEVALELAGRGAPFITVSSYSLEQLPPAFLKAPALSKPIAPQSIVAEISKLVTVIAS
jgi:DNA-binding response OmpR family regulator